MTNTRLEPREVKIRVVNPRNGYYVPEADIQITPSKLQYIQNRNEHDLAIISEVSQTYETKIPISVITEDGTKMQFPIGSIGKIASVDGGDVFRIVGSQLEQLMTGGRRRKTRGRRRHTRRRRHTTRRR